MNVREIVDYVCETPGNTNKMVLTDMIETYGGSDKPTGTIEITENGIIDVEQYADADVNVPSVEPVINSVTITENGTYEAVEGVDGYNPIIVNVPSGDYSETLLWELPEGTTSLSNGTFSNAITSDVAANYDYLKIEYYAVEGDTDPIFILAPADNFAQLKRRCCSIVTCANDRPGVTGTVRCFGMAQAGIMTQVNGSDYTKSLPLKIYGVNFS